MKILFTLSLVACMAIMTGCDGTKQGQSQTQTSGVDSVKVTTDGPASSSLTGITENPNRFPYIGVLGDSTLEFKAYTVQFKLQHEKPLVPITSDKLYWIDEDNSNEKLGVFLTYVPSGREINLGTTQIRVDYFSKALPGCANPDELFDWWQNTNMTAEGSRVLKDKHMVKTKGGQDAQVMELLAIRQDTVVMTPKYLAVAYLDHHDDYMIGMNLTAVDTFEFADILPNFYSLLESFE